MWLPRMRLHELGGHRTMACVASVSVPQRMWHAVVALRYLRARRWRRQTRGIQSSKRQTSFRLMFSRNGHLANPKQLKRTHHIFKGEAHIAHRKQSSFSHGAVHKRVTMYVRTWRRDRWRGEPPSEQELVATRFSSTYRSVARFLRAAYQYVAVFIWCFYTYGYLAPNGCRFKLGHVRFAKIWLMLMLMPVPEWKEEISPQAHSRI